MLQKCVEVVARSCYGCGRRSILIFFKFLKGMLEPGVPHRPEDRPNGSVNKTEGM